MLFLALGALIAMRTISHDLPHEQTFVFRFDESERHAKMTFSANLMRVGESEPLAGFSVTRDGTETGDLRHTLRLPDGEYVLAVDYTLARAGGGVRADADAALDAGIHARSDTEDAKEGETSRMERVTLTGGEIVVLLNKRVAE